MLSILIDQEENDEPFADIAICSICGWRGAVEECGTEEEGDWEGGYYNVDTCPVCPDGGCIDDYAMSEARAKEWDAWRIANAPASEPQQGSKPAGE